jgi:Zn-dependent protease with chaperone function
LDKKKAPELLSTHPADATRIQEIEHWLPEALSYYRPVR